MQTSLEHLESDLLSLKPKVDLTRRGFLGTSVVSGFTLAAGPIMAQTIVRTDTAGMSAGDIKIKVADGDLPAYVAFPASGGPFPVVLVVQEIFGVHEYIKDTCRRFAKLGYMAVAPDLYFRKADMSKVTDLQQALAIANSIPDSSVMADLDASMRYAAATGKGDTNRLGITGFCRGGRTVWMYSAHQPKLKAGVSWYGPVVGQKNDLTPRNPVDIAPFVMAPILGLYGAADQGIPNDTVEKMKKDMKKAGKKFEIVMYPNTPHAFHADYRPTYRKEAAEDGWKRLQDWFKQNGVA